MRTILTLSAVVVIGSVVLADEPKADPIKKPAIEKAVAAFAGTWQIESAQPAAITKEAKSLVFRKDMTYAALDMDGKELWAGTYDLDPTATPRVWDHRSDDAKKKGADALGIYELEGDTLKVCCVVGIWKEKEWTGKPRPTEFKLPSADVVIELRRVRREAK